MRLLFSRGSRSRFAAGVLAVLILSLPAFCGPIHDAAKDGDLAKVTALVQANPDLVFSKDDDGETPLHVAAENDRTNVVEFLLANKADVTAKDDGSSDTPLHKAARYGHKDVAELLLAKNADVNAKNVFSETPLIMAAMYDHKDVAELLLANKADVNAKDSIHETPLSAAASYGDRAMAELLLANNADINARVDLGGGTPLNVAWRHGHMDVVELLRQHGGTDEGVSAITPPAALFGYWRIQVDASTTHFANIDPWNREILKFRQDGMLDVRIETIAFSRGVYYVTAGDRIEIQLYSWPAPIVFDYSIANGVLTLKSTQGIQVYKYVSAE
jgi:ankyrin repeat protein